MDEFENFANRVREELVPQIENSSIFVSITPANPEKVDVKFALELGLAIMFDKPIIACISPETQIPQKLLNVVDRFVELDLKDKTQYQKLTNEIKAFLSQMKQ